MLAHASAAANGRPPEASAGERGLRSPLANGRRASWPPRPWSGAGEGRVDAGAARGLLHTALSRARAGAPATALDDRDICVLAEQLALAAERDVGIWIDRQTRNAGMVVSCQQM